MRTTTKRRRSTHVSSVQISRHPRSSFSRSSFSRSSFSRSSTPHTDTASPDDPNEISFLKGEVLDILDKQGKWWQAKKADGNVGSEFIPVPSLSRDTKLMDTSPRSCTIKLSTDHLSARTPCGRLVVVLFLSLCPSRLSARSRHAELSNSVYSSSSSAVLSSLSSLPFSVPKTSTLRPLLFPCEE